MAEELVQITSDSLCFEFCLFTLEKRQNYIPHPHYLIFDSTYHIVFVISSRSPHDPRTSPR